MDKMLRQDISFKKIPDDRKNLDYLNVPLEQ